MPLILTSLSGFMARRSTLEDIIVTLRADSYSSSDSTTYNTGAIDIGAVSATKVVLAAFSGRASANTTPTSITPDISGYSLNSLIKSEDYWSQRRAAHIAAWLVPDQSSIDIDITFSTTASAVSWTVWTLENVVSIAAADTFAARGVFPAGDIACPAGSALFGIGVGETAITPFAWTTVTMVSENNPANTSMSWTTSADTFATTQTALTVGLNPDASNSVDLIMASIR